MGPFVVVKFPELKVLLDLGREVERWWCCRLRWRRGRPRIVSPTLELIKMAVTTKHKENNESGNRVEGKEYDIVEIGANGRLIR